VPTEAHVEKFLESPFQFCQRHGTAWLNLSNAELDELQLAGLRYRFAQLRDAISMLKRLADNQSIHAIDRIEDVLPLLFNHQTYKSYPSVLLHEQRFDQLTRWLGKLTVHDLSQVDVSGCRSIDDWMVTLNRETPLSAIHTSGTSGTMSFIPCSKREWEKFVEHYLIWCFGDPAGIDLPLNIDCIYPYYRNGGWSHAAANDTFVKLIAGGEERFHAAYPGRLSSDLLLMGIRHRAAVARGETPTFHLAPELAARREEFEAQQRNMPKHLDAFFDTVCRELAGRRIFAQVTASMLIGVAEAGLRQGRKAVFAPDSVIVSGGGGKGVALPSDWEETVKKFFGVDRLAMSFGMSEMIGIYRRCEHGHYHAPPWNIPFLLDIDSGKPLPRAGRQSGRFAFYDLLAETRWGGFVTGDYITINWETPCPCGTTGPYFEGAIRRVSDVLKDVDGEEKISCAHTPEAYEDALEFLNAVA
jgi:hypothetical protein